MKTDEKKLLKEIKHIAKNFDNEHAKQSTKRQAFLENPKNADLISDVKLGMRVAKSMYDARKQAGLTQKELAEKLHTRQSYIADVERGRRNITLDTLERFAIACGKHVEIRLA